MRINLFVTLARKPRAKHFETPRYQTEFWFGPIKGRIPRVKKNIKCKNLLILRERTNMRSREEGFGVKGKWGAGGGGFLGFIRREDLKRCFIPNLAA